MKYLCSFDTDRLLAGFRETAGISMRGAVRYPGWESMLIGGHTLGHFMTACVKACESANCGAEDREKLVGILRELTEGLNECQEALGSGFLFGAQIVDKSNPEQQFDLVTGHHTYVTGGNSEWEHFGEDNVLDAERTNCNCETCNAYNML